MTAGIFLTTPPALDAAPAGYVGLRHRTLPEISVFAHRLRVRWQSEVLASSSSRPLETVVEWSQELGPRPEPLRVIAGGYSDRHRQPRVLSVETVELGYSASEESHTQDTYSRLAPPLVASRDGQVMFVRVESGHDVQGWSWKRLAKVLAEAVAAEAIRAGCSLAPA